MDRRLKKELHPLLKHRPQCQYHLGHPCDCGIVEEVAGMLTPPLDVTPQPPLPTLDAYDLQDIMRSLTTARATIERQGVKPAHQDELIRRWRNVMEFHGITHFGAHEATFRLSAL